MSEVKTMFYEVVKPPSSGEVRDEVFRAIMETSGRICVNMVADKEFPPPQEEEVCFRIRQTDHPQTGESMVVTGRDDQGNSVRVETYEPPETPATASRVVTEE
ncbi:hypothetical protein BRC19_01260 [Candidatus Saccharibacteria bacterium QS_5_54_17]|nr:MAG: hypothetical protein BRC19_01260 [Candidatus Saccharibacteria bacterium QS_5_54_17]